MGKSQEAARAATRVAEEAVSKHGDEITLSNGIVLRLRPVPPLLVRRAAMEVLKPTVPVIWNEEKGREEENPAHPDYLQAMADYRATVSMAAADAMLLCGTSLASLPDGMSPPESGGWAETLAALGITVDGAGPARYLAWLRYYALETEGDLIRALAAVGRLTGVTEEDVAQAVASFRGRKEWGADRDGAAEAGAENGDRVQAEPGGAGS